MAASSTRSPATTPTARCGSPRGRPSSFTASSSRNLKATMKAIDAALLDTIAACGDVNRNVMCGDQPVPVARPRGGLSTSPGRSRDHLLPQHAAPIARSGSTAKRSSAARTRWSSRSTARPTCRGNSRSWSRCRRQRRRHVRAGSRLHRDPRRGGRSRGLQRDRRRRHGHDPRRAGHLSPHRRRDGLLPTRGRASPSRRPS